MCTTFMAAATAGSLIAWAQCWFLALVMIVIVTIFVLFILAMLAIAGMNRKI